MEYNDSTALIVVDVQNDFADPEGNLYVSGGEKAIDYINSQIAEAVSAGATIVYSQDWHPPTTPHFQKDGGIWPVHCVADTEGAAFHPALEIIQDGVFIKKGRGGEDGYSAFHLRDPESGEVTATGLLEQLDDMDAAVVVGLALDYCVKETAIDAAEHFATTLLADGTRPVNLSPGDAARAVSDMVLAGVTIA